jgi:hypothetical protein
MSPRRTLTLLTVLIAALQFWGARFYMTSDGVSYLDIARSLEVNPYWSPLFSWLLAPVVRLLPLSWTTPALHAFQALFAIAAVLLADRLWSRLAPDSVNDGPWLLTRWMIAWWMAFSLTSVALVQPDLLCLALGLLACLFVLDRRPYALGLVLALGYLTKAAFLPFALALLLCWAFQHRRPALTAAAILVLLCLPWWLALHQHTGRWTIGDSGPINYAWEVRGVTRWIHGQGGPHSTYQIAQSPDAFVYPEPIHSTYPPWYNPTYWFTGLEKVPFSLPDQLRALQENGFPALWNWFSTPGLIAVLALAGRIKDWSGLFAEVRRHWVLLLPALATLGMYVIVFFETRYLALSFFLLGSVPVYAAYRRGGPPARFLFPGAAIAALAVTLLVPLGVVVKNIFQESTLTNPYALAAHELRTHGLVPGTKVAFIGLTLNPEWARQAELRIIGDVPMTYDRDPGPERRIIFNPKNHEAFWKGTAANRQNILDGFARAGARYAVSHFLPKEADSTGWTQLTAPVDLFTGPEPLWIRPLSPR